MLICDLEHCVTVAEETVEGGFVTLPYIPSPENIFAFGAGLVSYTVPDISSLLISL